MLLVLHKYGKRVESYPHVPLLFPPWTMAFRYLYDVSWHTTIPTPTILTKTRPVVVVAVALWASLTSHPAMPISTLHGVVQSTPPWMQEWQPNT